MSIRVHELAKEFKISTAALKKQLGDLGVVVKSHMSPVDDEIVKKLRSRFNEEMSAVKQAQQERRIIYKKIVRDDIEKKIIRDLIAIYNYPPQRIIQAPEIKFGERILRPDIVVYEDNELEKALLVIEIKQYLIPELQERTKQQILQYGTILNAKYAIVILPTYKFAYCIKNNKLFEIEEIPIYDEETGFKDLTVISTERTIDILKKDKFTITGNDFLEEQKKIILKSGMKQFIENIKDYFNLEENREFNFFLEQYKNYTSQIDLIIISDKINIMEQVQRLISDEKKIHSQDFINFLHENREKINLNKEQEIANVRIEERNKIIASLSHSLKNTLSTVIDPLENLKKEKEFKQVTINNAIRGANLIREIVNAMNLSVKGSIEDFQYDAINNSGKDKKDFQEMFIESLKYSISPMFDGKYFNKFMRNYFPDETIFIEARDNWNEISQSMDLLKIKNFMSEYMLKPEIDIELAKDFAIGNDKGSSLKFLILIQEMVFNAVKYSSFIPKEERLMKISFVADKEYVTIKVTNVFKHDVNVKSTGLGQEIINNFSKLLQTKPAIEMNENEYIVEIKFDNLWRNE